LAENIFHLKIVKNNRENFKLPIKGYLKYDKITSTGIEEGEQ
jgi:hypothetical protein